MHSRNVASSSTLGRMRRPTATTVSAARTSASGSLGRNGLGLFACQPKRMIAWNFGLGHALVDVGGNYGIGRNADAGEQIETPRARRGEDETQAQVPWGPGPPRPGMKR